VVIVFLVPTRIVLPIEILLWGGDFSGYFTVIILIEKSGIEKRQTRRPLILPGFWT